MRAALEQPPATLLVLPNGWVKVAAALPEICADLRRETLVEAWEAYREAWRTSYGQGCDPRRDRGRVAPRPGECLAGVASDPRLSASGGSMSESKTSSRSREAPTPQPRRRRRRLRSRVWETPKLEDVSEQVMAQPYIRFT